MKNTLCMILLLIGLGNAKAQTADQLEKAYQEKSTEKLKTFFDDWAKDLQPATARQRKKLSKPAQQAYHIFETFYNPHDLENRGGSQFGNKIYEGFNYLIIQNKLKIHQKEKIYYTAEEALAYTIENIKKNVDKKYHEKWLATIETGGDGQKHFINSYGPDNKMEWEDSLKTLIDSIRDFRPNLIQTKGTPLYLNDSYKKLLDKFLGNAHYALGTGDIMNPAQAKDESAARQKFLGNFIKIYYGHWGGYWQLHSYPTIGSIIFDKDLKYAKIYYNMIYEGGEALLKFENKTWKLLSVKRTWIE
jgi:hypothetical protein